jgi:hypothetical protein
MIGTHAGMFTYGDNIPGASWGYTFGTDEGVFEFMCTYHPEMQEAIVVRNGASGVGAPVMQTPAPCSYDHFTFFILFFSCRGISKTNGDSLCCNITGLNFFRKFNYKAKTM